MNVKATYKTKQRQQLEDYLKTVPGVHVTVGDICEHFREQGISIGQTTVYRQLDRMVDEGVVNKYMIDANSPACFEYIQRDCHCRHGVCFHCKCEKCGKLIHLNAQEMQKLQEYLLGHYHFVIDSTRTVLYGLCEDCR